MGTGEGGHIPTAGLRAPTLGACCPTGTWGPRRDFMAKRMIWRFTKMNSSTKTWTTARTGVKHVDLHPRGSHSQPGVSPTESYSQLCGHSRPSNHRAAQTLSKPASTGVPVQPIRSPMNTRGGPTNSPASTEAPTHVLSLPHRCQDPTGTPAQPREGPESSWTAVPHRHVPLELYGHLGSGLTGAARTPQDRPHRSPGPTGAPQTPRARFHGRPGPTDTSGPSPRAAPRPPDSPSCRRPSPAPR